MSSQNPIDLAKQAERDLSSEAARKGHDFAKGASDSTIESGVDESVTKKFPGSNVVYGSAASGAGDNREIPESEGGGVDPATGRPYKARDFEGAGGPEDKARILADQKGGSDGVHSQTVRQ